MALPTYQVTSDILTMLSIIGVIAVLISVHFTSPRLTDAGDLPPQKLRFLTVGVTIGATLFTMLVSGRMQQAFLRSLENPIRKIGLDDPLTFSTGQIDGSHQKDTQWQQLSLAEIDKRWRGALRIDNLREMVSNWRILLMFILAGLNTTSIVTSLTPTPAFHKVPFSPRIPDTSFGEYHNESLRPCVGVAPDTINYSNVFYWDFSNGSVFYASLTDVGCPPTFCTFLAAAINTVDPHDYAYTDLGVLVDRTAMGASAAVYNGSVIQEASSKYGQSLNYTTQCVPVMTTTPFQCKPGGAELEVISDHELRITSTTLGGNVSFVEGYSRNFTRDSAMIGLVTVSSSQAIGGIVFYIGGYTDPEGQTPFANYIAQTVNDPDPSAGTEGGSTYTVSCLVNPEKSFEYRTVTLGRNSDRVPYLFGGETCTPTTPTISNKLFVTVAAGVSHLLNVDNYLATLMNIAGGDRGPPYAFNNSKNALEDSLGVLAAMAVSRIPMDGGVVADAVGDPAYATVQVTRLGSESSEILFLLIPPICSLFILAYLFKQSFQAGWQPGGDLYRGLPKSERPRQYAAETLVQLLSLREASLSRVDSLDLSSATRVEGVAEGLSHSDEQRYDG